MHFFNFDGMVSDLKADRVSEPQYFQYLFGYFVLLRFPHEAVVSIFSNESPAKPQSMAVQWAGYVLGLAILYWIVSGFYRLNRGDRGRNFFVRYFLLSWVVGLRSLAVSLPVIVFASFLASRKLAGVSPTLVGFILGAMVVVALTGILYYFIKMRQGFRLLGEHDRLMGLGESTS